MNTANNIITLSNGKEVLLEEFSSWSKHKQKISLFPPNKGRKFGEDFKNKIRESRKKGLELGTIKIISGGDHVNARKVMTPKGYFDCLKDAAIAFDVRGATLRDWIKKNKDGFYFVDKARPRKPQSKKGGLSGVKNKAAKAILTPEGRFDSIKAAGLHFGLNPEDFGVLLKTQSHLFKFEKEYQKPKAYKNLQHKPVVTPEGRFDSLKLAALHYGLTGEGMRYRVVSGNWPEFYYENVKS